LASPDVPFVYCAAVGPAVAIFLSAVVSSQVFLLARVSAVAAVPTALLLLMLPLHPAYTSVPVVVGLPDVVGPCHVVGIHAVDGIRCCQRSCCYNVFNVAGGPAVIPALFGILKHYTVKTVKLAEYDYRTINFRNNYLGKLLVSRLSDFGIKLSDNRLSDPGKIINAQL
jgi:hypothetical protein